MTGIYSVTHPLAETVTDVLKRGFKAAGDLTGRAVTIVQSLPHQMQANRNVAIGAFATANTICFVITHKFSNWLDRNIEEEQDLDADQRMFKNILLSAIIGSTTFGFNVAISRATNYPISHSIKVAIALASIGAHFLFNRATAEEIEINKDDFIEEKEVNSKKKINKSKEEEVEEELVDDKKKAEDAQKKLEADKKAAEDKKKAEDAQKKLEADKKAAEDKKKAEDAQKKLEADKKAAEDKKKAEDAQKKLDADKKAAEDKKKAEDAQKKLDADKKAAEDKKEAQDAEAEKKT